MQWNSFVFVGLLALVTERAVENCGQHQSKQPHKMELLTPHPGVIRMIDDDTREVRVVNADEVPMRRRFVYLDRTGKELEATDTNATERVPIVEVRMTPTDGDGHVVPRAQARLIRIKESGPDNRVLRSTTLRKN